MKLGKSDLDFKKPLTPDVLSNPEHPFVKTLIYIYSMQSFIYSDMNKASRNKDISSIRFFGAYACALGFIIHCGNKQNTSLTSQFTTYRGVQMPLEEAQSIFVPNSKVSLAGFTSTSLDLQ